MTKMNGVEFKQNLVAAANYGIKCPFAMSPKKVTIHETDNSASAANEVAYMIRNSNQTSFHIAIDDVEAVQGIRLDRNAWHAGDGGNGYGNRNTISFEICHNFDRNTGSINLPAAQQVKYDRAKQNAVKVVPAVMIQMGINGTPDNVKTHNDWSGKLCPRKMISEGLFIPFRDQVIAEWARLKNSGQPAPTPTPTPTPQPPKPAPTPGPDQILNVGSTVKFGGVYRVDRLDYKHQAVASATLAGGTPGGLNYIDVIPLIKTDSRGNRHSNQTLLVGDYFVVPGEFRVKKIDIPTQGALVQIGRYDVWLATGPMTETKN